MERSSRPTNADLLAVLSTAGGLLFGPGFKFEYSNTGYDVLGALIERVSGETYPDFLQENIFGPLGMKNTFSLPSPRQKTDPLVAHSYVRYQGVIQPYDTYPLDDIVGSGTIYSTVEDMFLYDQALYTDAIVRQSTLAQAFQPAVLYDGTEYPYGFGWELKEENGILSYWHSGKWLGYQSYYERFPDLKLSIVVLMNWNYGPDVEKIESAVRDIYLPISLGIKPLSQQVPTKPRQKDNRSPISILKEEARMRFSECFGSTLREDPSEADTASARLLLRAAYIRPLASGIFSFLPLGFRVKTKIERILREEMESIGGQELLMPVVHPAEIWKRTGRWQRIGAEMGRLQDRAGRDLVLAMTHEEVVAALAASEIRSYRDLPRLIFHLQTKWRDDPRPRAGLIRVREFTMLDSYSLDATASGMEAQYRAHDAAYRRIFRRCGLPVVAVESDAGMMGGKAAQEFMYLTPIGEDTLLICPSCDYRANRQAARFRKPVAPAEEPRPLEKVATPGVTFDRRARGVSSSAAGADGQGGFPRGHGDGRRGAARALCVFRRPRRYGGE